MSQPVDITSGRARVRAPERVRTLFTCIQGRLCTVEVVDGPEFSVVDLRCDHPSTHPFFPLKHALPSANQKANALGSGSVRRYRRRCARATEQPNERLAVPAREAKPHLLTCPSSVSKASSGASQPARQLASPRPITVHGVIAGGARAGVQDSKRGRGSDRRHLRLWLALLLLRRMSSQSGSHIGAASMQGRPCIRRWHPPMWRPNGTAGTNGSCWSSVVCLSACLYGHPVGLTAAASARRAKKRERPHAVPGGQGTCVSRAIRWMQQTEKKVWLRSARADKPTSALPPSSSRARVCASLAQLEQTAAKRPSGPCRRHINCGGPDGDKMEESV